MNTRRFARRLFNRFNCDSVLNLKTNLYTSGRRLIGLSAKISEDNLVAERKNVTDKFPLVWLRDNCTCENCFHKPSQSRIINWRNFDLNVKVTSVETKDENNIQINWQDGHKSTFSWDWLEKRSFRKEQRERYQNDVYLPPKKLWDKHEFLDVMKKYEYKDVMNNDEALYLWLKDLAVYGVALIKNAPLEEEECKRISQKVAFVKETQFGDDFYITAKKDANNVAYLSNTLQLHTDLPYYDYMPGVSLLHCIIQANGKGGENLLVDAFYVAEKLRANNKDIFDVLSRTEVNWFNIGAEHGKPFHKIHQTPIISLDKNGNLHRIRQSVTLRDSHFNVDIEEVKPFYEALKIFVDEIYNCSAYFKTEPGDVLAFDNTRLLHGRIKYEDTQDMKRLLVGSYLDWDEIYSRIRVLSKRFSQAFQEST